jgi:opacity protein-like surface antigen
MRIVLGVCGTALMIVTGASVVSAQVVVQHQPSERVAAGVALGSFSNGDLPSPNGGMDVAASLEAPLGRQWRVRGDVGRVEWPFEFHQDGFRITVEDRMTLSRATLTLLRVRPASGVLRLGMYAGAGAGLYHYSFERAYAPASTRGGFHALAGLEVVPRDRVAITGELQLHVIDGPTDGPVPPGRDGDVFGSTMLALRGAVGVKLRF